MPQNWKKYKLFNFHVLKMFKSRFLVESFRKDQTKKPELLKKLDKTVRRMKNRDALIGTMSEQFKKHNQFVKRFTFSY